MYFTTCTTKFIKCVRTKLVKIKSEQVQHKLSSSKVVPFMHFTFIWHLYQVHKKCENEYKKGLQCLPSMCSLMKGSSIMFLLLVFKIFSNSLISLFWYELQKILKKIQEKNKICTKNKIYSQSKKLHIVICFVYNT